MAKRRQVSPMAAKAENQTYVDSKAYSPHTRARRGTHKPAVLNDAMQASGKNTAAANIYGKLIKDQTDRYSLNFKTGQFWQNLLSALRKQYKMHQNWEPALLRNMEINKSYPFRSRFKGNFIPSASITDGILEFRFTYDEHPIFRNIGIDSYKLVIFAVFVDYENLIAESALIFSEVLHLDSVPQPIIRTVPVPDNANHYLIGMRIDGISKGIEYTNDASKGMMIVEVGRINVLIC